MRLRYDAAAGGLVVESTQLWWSVRARTTASARSRCGFCDDPDPGGRVAGAGGDDRPASHHRARLRRARYEGRWRNSGRPRDRGEPLAGDSLRRRWADGLDFRRGEEAPTRSLLEQGWSGPSRRGRSWDRPGAAGAQRRPAGAGRRSIRVPRSRTSTATRCRNAADLRRRSARLEGHEQRLRPQITFQSGSQRVVAGFVYRLPRR